MPEIKLLLVKKRNTQSTMITQSNKTVSWEKDPLQKFERQGAKRLKTYEQLK